MALIGKRSRTSDDVRRMALAAIAAAVEEARQGGSAKKPRLRGVTALAAGAALFTAGRAAFSNRELLRDQLSRDGGAREDEEAPPEEEAYEEPEAEAEEEPEAEAEEEPEAEQEPEAEEPEEEEPEAEAEDEEPEAEAEEEEPAAEAEEEEPETEDYDEEAEEEPARPPRRSRAPVART